MTTGLHIMGKTLEYESLTSKLDQIDIDESWARELKEFVALWISDIDIFNVPTSGSTGNPKNISIHRDDLIQSAKYSIDFLHLKSGMTSLLCLPIKYIAGKLMLIRSMEAKMNCVIVKPASDPLLGIKDQIDFLAITPFQLHNILKCKESREKLANIKSVIIGGGLANSKDINELRDFGSKAYLTYGMTETLTHIAMSEISKNSNESEYKLINSDFSISSNDSGLLQIQSPYRHMKTVKTNDIVEILGKERFILKGRADNVINSGGIKLFPEEIERAYSSFMTLPYFITSLDDESLGQKLILVVEAIDDNNQLIKELKLLVERQISNSILHPKEIRVLSSFVYTENGKIQRKATEKKLQ